MNNKIHFLILISVLIFSSSRKRGCTDPLSLAYEIDASKDDGSCTYPEDEKKTLVFNSTGTWCQHCGDWGKTFSDNLSNNFSKGVTFFFLNNENVTGGIRENNVLNKKKYMVQMYERVVHIRLNE